MPFGTSFALSSCHVDFSSVFLIKVYGFKIRVSIIYCRSCILLVTHLLFPMVFHLADLKVTTEDSISSGWQSQGIICLHRCVHLFLLVVAFLRRFN